MDAAVEDALPAEEMESGAVAWRSSGSWGLGTLGTLLAQQLLPRDPRHLMGPGRSPCALPTRSVPSGACPPGPGLGPPPLPL